MRQVNTKSELANAIKAGEEHIICGGDAANALSKECERSSKESIISKNRNKRNLLLGSILCVVSLAAAPITAGASLGMGAVISGGALASATGLAGLGAIAAGLTIGSITMTSQELMIICGTFLTNKALDKLYEIHFSKGLVKLDAKPTTK